MSCLRPFLLAAVGSLLLGAPLAAQQGQPKDDEDQTSPALLELIRQRFASTEGLRPADGVEIRETKFFMGTLRVTGKVARQEQVETVRRTLDGMRRELGSTVDVRINALDLSRLTVKPAAKPPEPGKMPSLPSRPREESPPATDGCVWYGPWFEVPAWGGPGCVGPVWYGPGFEVPGWCGTVCEDTCGFPCPPFPCAPSKNHFHWGHKGSCHAGCDDANAFSGPKGSCPRCWGWR